MRKHYVRFSFLVIPFQYSNTLTRTEKHPVSIIVNARWIFFSLSLSRFVIVRYGESTFSLSLFFFFLLWRIVRGDRFSIIIVLWCPLQGCWKFLRSKIGAKVFKYILTLEFYNARISFGVFTASSYYQVHWILKHKVLRIILYIGWRVTWEFFHKILIGIRAFFLSLFFFRKYWYTLVSGKLRITGESHIFY